MTGTHTIFLVDDDADDREIFSLALEEVDDSIVCVTAANGFEALAKLNDNALQPTCIFLDLNMPRMDGKQCLLELKKDSALRHIPVVIYSTSSEPKDIAETLAMGASDFLAKPPGINELIGKLRVVLTKFV
jgi:CheY-like chemotaxis protein